jgi:hypothetical protein
MNTSDIIFILIIIVLLILAVIVLLLIKREENKIMSVEEKSKKTMLDLDKITANIERDYKPLNIELTSYEQEQEDNAVISYEELKNKSTSVTYEEEPDETGVKKIDFNKTIDLDHTQKIDVPLLSNYEKEEAFLRALRQLQKDLAK